MENLLEAVINLAVVIRKNQYSNKIRSAFYRNKTSFLLRLLVLSIVFIIVVSQRIFWTPDTLFIVLLVVFTAFGQARGFIIRFFPLVLLITLYDLFRGIADDLNRNVHFTEMIEFDRWMFFGKLPTVVLQEWWWHGVVRWYDFYFYFLYTMHFVSPVLLAVVIWKKADKHYWQYMWALVGLSFAAFVTYVLYPAAPPWMASIEGYIEEPMRRVSSDIWWAMGINDFDKLYDQLPANPVAAIPSLHSAYPLLISLFTTGLFGMKRFWWIYIYPISMWVGVVYIGEHYVIDVILGAMYATLAYFLSVAAFNWYYKPKRKLRILIASLMVRLRLDF